VVDPSAAHREALALEQEKARLAETRAAADHRRAVALEGRKAALAAEKADLDDQLAQESAAADHDREHRTLVHTAMVEVAKAGIDRSRDSAKFVQTAAAALMGAYTGLLALVFSVTGRQLPFRGVYAATFLGAAIAFAVGYLAFLYRSGTVDGYRPAPSIVETQLRRTANFVEWTNAAVTRRAWALRASVLAFGVGVAFIPAAFVGPTSAATPTAGAPEPPAIPERVPAALEEPARRLFEHQVDAYFEALGTAAPAVERGSGNPGLGRGRPDGMPGPPGAGAGTDGADGTEADDDGCPFGLVRSCGWRTEDDVERNFRWLALVGLAVVVGGAALPRWLPRSKGPGPGTARAGNGAGGSGGPGGGVGTSGTSGPGGSDRSQGSTGDEGSHGTRGPTGPRGPDGSGGSSTPSTPGDPGVQGSAAVAPGPMPMPTPMPAPPSGSGRRARRR
jgi:hypothetical protein